MGGENNSKPHSGKWELNSFKDLKKKTSFADLSSISSGIWWNVTCMPVLFGLFNQNSGQSLSLIHSPTAILNIDIKTSAEKWAARLTNILLLFFFACIKGHAYSAQNTNPIHLRGGRGSRQPKGAIPWCHNTGGEQQVTSCRRSLQGGKDGTHTLLSPPSCQPTQPKMCLIFPRSFTGGSLNRWFSEGKNLGVKQRLW